MIMRICRGCGCTDRDACTTAHGPCHWVSLDPPICSACADEIDEAAEPAYGASPCSASSAGMHSLLWTGEHRAYCTRCGTEFRE